MRHAAHQNREVRQNAGSIQPRYLPPILQEGLRGLAPWDLQLRLNVPLLGGDTQRLLDNREFRHQRWDIAKEHRKHRDFQDPSRDHLYEHQFLRARLESTRRLWFAANNLLLQKSTYSYFYQLSSSKSWLQPPPCPHQEEMH